MEGKKNLCAMIPAELHARIMAEKEEMKLGTLAEYVERIFAEHFEGGNDMQTERTLAVKISAELFDRLKEYLEKNHLKQKDLHHATAPAGAGQRRRIIKSLDGRRETCGHLYSPEVRTIYIYPDNLTAKAMLWLWELRDIGIIGVGLLISVLALTQTGIALPLVLTAVYAFLSIRFDGTSILDFLKYAAAFLITKQQFYDWRLES